MHVPADTGTSARRPPGRGGDGRDAEDYVHWSGGPGQRARSRVCCVLHARLCSPSASPLLRLAELTADVSDDVPGASDVKRIRFEIEGARGMKASP